MKNFLQKNLVTVLILVAVATVAQGAFTLINWNQINSSTTPITLAGYNIGDGALDADLDAHVASSTDVHGTTGAVVGASGTQTLYGKTLTDSSNHISGTQVDSGTVAEARIDSAIARDIELPLNASFSFIGLGDTPATFTGQSLKSVRLNVGESALEFFTPATGATFKRAEKYLDTGATTTVTFGLDVEGNAVAIGTFGKCVVSYNGVDQAYDNFTKTSPTVIESTQGVMASGTLVILKQID